MMTDSTSTTEAGGNVCLNIVVDLETKHEEDEINAKTALKELIDLIDRHKRRSQPNSELPLEINLGSKSEPKVVFVGFKFDRNLKNQLITLFNEFKDFFA